MNASHQKTKAVMGNGGVRLSPEMLVSPLLEKLSDMAVERLGLRLVIVFPSENGLDQVLVGSSDYLNTFCKLVQSSHDGADHCRMCHLVMTRAARPDSPLEHRCHTGASALVKLVSGHEDSSLAVLSSCCFIGQDPAAVWPQARRRAKDMGLDEQALKKAFDGMTRLDSAKLKVAEQIMGMASDAISLLVDKLLADAALDRERKARAPGREVSAALEKELLQAVSTLKEKAQAPHGRKGSKRGVSPIDIVSDVVASKPHLPFSLRSVAAACHITPNHFSFLFHQRHGECFSEYLTGQRLKYSRILLKDLTLNISQVAARAGFKDAGYFARRFKQKIGMSPRQWRLKLER